MQIVSWTLLDVKAGALIPSITRWFSVFIVLASGFMARDLFYKHSGVSTHPQFIPSSLFLLTMAMSKCSTVADYRTIGWVDPE
jgi:hypothetical protein